MSLNVRSNMPQDIKTFIFFDSETTGLPQQEHNKTRITELCFAAVQTDHITLGVFPRIIPKISLCFNPRKLVNPSATEISGLSNDILEMQPEFNTNSAALLQDFINTQRKPVCFVAHNGNRFDYPILRAELYKAGRDLSSDILCIDSLTAFKQLYNEDHKQASTITTQNYDNVPIELQDGYDELLCSVLEDLKNSRDDIIPTTSIEKPLTIEEVQKRNETTPQKQIIRHHSHSNNSNHTNVRRQLPFGKQVNFKLSTLYESLTDKEAVDAHRAESDVLMLIECVSKIGQTFVDWANVNASKFCDIPMMRPGKPIGT